MNYARIYKIKDSTTSINSHNNSYDGSYIVRPDRSQVRQRFNDLARRWLTETAYTSSPTDIVSNASYQSIIAMGAPALPYIFSELEKQPHFWFPALVDILHQHNTEPPMIDEQYYGDFRRMADIWLEWGKQNNYID